MLYNFWKLNHGVKFQTVAGPDGLDFDCAGLYTRRHRYLFLLQISNMDKYRNGPGTHAVLAFLILSP